jgi:hypothetical protein
MNIRWRRLNIGTVFYFDEDFFYVGYSAKRVINKIKR